MSQLSAGQRLHQPFFSSDFLPKFWVFLRISAKILCKILPQKARIHDIRDKKKRVNAAFATTTKKRNVNNVTSIATVYWYINVDSTFVYLGPLDFNKDSNNHICCRQMLYKGLVIIITALFSDCKTFGKILRISVKFCHWNPKNSEILSKLRNSELCGASGGVATYHHFSWRLFFKCILGWWWGGWRDARDWIEFRLWRRGTFLRPPF